MSPDYTEESLQLAITEAVYASNTGSSMNTLLQQLFGADYDTNVSNTLKNYVRRYYINQLKGFIRHFGKKHIYEQLKAGSAAFIQRFEVQETLNNLFNDVTRVQCRINHLLKEKSEGSLFIEFSRYFTRLRNHFVPLQIEETFRLTLVEWLQSGEMTKTIRNEINTWFTNGSKLNQFKQMNFATATKRDSYKAKVMKAVQSIKTNEFVQLDHLKNILSKFFAPAEMNINNGKLRLCGRTIFVSDWIAKIVQQREKNSNLDVEIYAVDCCGIDCDINLYGINLVICSNKVYVWNSHLINLSGLTYKPGKSKAKNAENSSENGSDGKHGCPGYSSGNFNLNAKEMINPSLLSLYLNGGRGQDGDDGGDGYNGVNGIGITKEELEKLCVNYSSLYFNWWDTFQKYSPPKNWTAITTKWNKSNQFGYEEYQDEHKRKIIYSFAGDVGYFYTTYHLYFMVQGSNGTMSTQGGSNGTGGEGGYRGNAVAENPETGEAFAINIYRNMGENGLNGLVGTSGKIGTNGNDMALIDVSITGGQKKIIGSSNTKLSTSYDYEATTDNRFNGHRKHIEKQSACFARFSTTTIDQTERRAAAAVQNTEFSRASKAVAKKHIIANEVLSYAENFFKTENAFLADACKQRATAKQNNENENEENEATENVTEEVVILRQHDETPKVFKYTPDSEKKTRPKVTPEILIEHIKKIGRRGTIGSIAQNIFDLFSIEISIELLNAVALYTLFQKNRFRRNVIENRFALALIAAQQDRLVNGKSFSEIVTFAKDVTNRRQQKYAFAKLNGHLKKFIDEFEDVKYNPNLSIDVGENKIYGMKRVDFKININAVRKTTREFFRDFTKYRVQQDLLELFNYFFKRIHDKYASSFEDFNEQIDWTDKKSYEAYFNMLQAWLKEKTTTSSGDKDDERTKKSLPSLRSKTTLEARFEELITILQNDRKYVNNSLDELHKHIKANKELTARFGDVPTFEEKKSLKQKITRSSGNQDIYDDIEPTLQIIRFYWLAFRILTYMRHLYNCNELFAIEMKKIEYKGIYTDDGHHIDFENFLERARKQPLDIAR